MGLGWAWGVLSRHVLVEHARGIGLVEAHGAKVVHARDRVVTSESKVIPTTGRIEGETSTAADII